MSKQISCELIQDLLPSYVDGIVSEVSKHAVEEHVRECEKCAAVLKSMQTEEEHLWSSEQQDREIDFLKKVKRRNRSIIICIAVAAVILMAITIKFLMDLYSGSYILTSVDYHVQVENNKLLISGEVPEGFVYEEGVVLNEGEALETRISFRPKTPLDREPEKNFKFTYDAKKEIEEVMINGVILWQDGVEISEYAISVYEEKHPYVGDASANAEVAYALGMENHFGNFTSELQTEKEPYEWKIVLKKQFDGDVSKSDKKKMKSFSFVMLTLIDNLGVVSWEFDTKKGKEVYSVTTENAAKKLGKDVKSYGDSPKEFQSLLNLCFDDDIMHNGE